MPATAATTDPTTAAARHVRRAVRAKRPPPRLRPQPQLSRTEPSSFVAPAQVVSRRFVVRSSTMANITAEQVKKLRDQTGAGMMECKNALSEANGDFDEANTILRKRGLASAAKKAGRVAKEGLIGHKVSSDHASGVLVEVNCESDFVARTDDFLQLIADVLAAIEQKGDAADEAWLTDPQGPVRTRVAAAIGKLGENMAVPRFIRYAGNGYVGQYIHLGGKIGVQVEFAGVSPAMADREELTTLVKEIAMQIAAVNP